MTHRIHWYRKPALVGGCFVLSSALLAGQSAPPATPAPTQAATIPSVVDAPVARYSLIEAFHNRSALQRVELLEQVDASPAFDQVAAVSLLRDALHDEDLLVREAALRALIQRDSEQDPVLTEADVAAFQGEVADLANVHLATRREDTAALRELLVSGDATVQEDAFEALAAKDPASAAEALRAELRDTHSLHRLQTLQLMERSSYTNSSKDLQPILQDAATDADPLVRDYAMRALKEKTQEAESVDAH